MPNTADFRATYAASLAFLPAREELPTLRNERRLFGCGVEIGVQEGIFSDHLLRHWQGMHLISVDPWAEDEAATYVDIANVPQSEHEQRYTTTCLRLGVYGSRSSIWRMTSIEAAEYIPNHSLDFVYVDARHDFDSVVEDLEAWYPKVRPGGIIAGHDYVDDDGPSGNFRVKSAVDAFFGRLGLAVHATLLDAPWLSWLVEIPFPARDSLAQPGAARETPAASRPAPMTEPIGVANGNGSGNGNGTEERHRDVKLTLALGSGPRAFRLRLDQAQLSQRMMLEDFDADLLYEPETSKLLATVLRPGDIFVDVGSHVGYFSMLAASLVGSDGAVIAFEPDVANFRQLKKHIELNGFQHVVPFNAAVGDRTAEVDFHINVDNDGGHALWEVGSYPYNKKSRATPSTRRVAMVSLDDALADLDIPAPRAVKIDVEGAEHTVLRGARRTLVEKPIAFVIAEVNRFGLEKMGTSETDLRKFMSDLGYETFVFDPAVGSFIEIGEDAEIHTDRIFNLLFRHPAAAAA